MARPNCEHVVNGAAAAYVLWTGATARGGVTDACYAAVRDFIQAAKIVAKAQ